MSRSSQNQNQRSLPPMELRRSESDRGEFRKSDGNCHPFRQSEDELYAVSARLFKSALEDKKHGMSRDEAAFVLDVSRSLIDKWCAEDVKASPSDVQLLGLGMAFYLAYRSAHDGHFDVTSHVLKRLSGAFADAALAMGA